MGVNLWTPEQTETLLRMKSSGYRVAAIAKTLGRTEYAVTERWRWFNRDEEKKQARRDQVNKARRRDEYIPSPHKMQGYSTVASRPTQEMLEAAEARLLAPRTISQQLLGDPPFGYSALERRA